MKLEQRVKELEKKLAIKQALLNVKFTFPKDTPTSVKKDVEEALKAASLTLAEEQEVVADASQEAFTASEIEVLKMLAGQAQKRVSVSSKTPTPQPEPAESTLKEIRKANQKLEQPLEARLLTVDRVDARVRRKLEPEALVRVVSMNADTATVSWQAPRVNKNLPGNVHNFKIPLEDIQLLESKEN